MWAAARRAKATPTSSGRAALKDKDYKQAIELFTEAIKKEPGNAKAYEKRMLPTSIQGNTTLQLLIAARPFDSIHAWLTPTTLGARRPTVYRKSTAKRSLISAR